MHSSFHHSSHNNITVLHRHCAALFSLHKNRPQSVVLINQNFLHIFFSLCLFRKMSNNLGIALSSLVTDLTPQLGCLNAATLFHNTLLHRVLHAPAEFFDTIPCGRILARFSKDIEVLDSDLPQLVSDSVYITFEVNP